MRVLRGNGISAAFRHCSVRGVVVTVSTTKKLLGSNNMVILDRIAWRIHRGTLCSLMSGLLLLPGFIAPVHAADDQTQSNQKPGSASSDDDLKEIVVVAYKITRGSVGSLVDAPIQDIPRNMEVITEQTLNDQLVGSTLDILSNWAGVERGSQSPGAEHPRVRGLEAYQFLEGSYSGGVIWDSAEFIGAGEIMTGPNSVQYGFLVQGGGAINYLLKRPQPDAYLDVLAQANSFGDNKYVFDANQPFADGTVGDGLRAIGVHESIASYENNSYHGERNSAGAMLTYSDILGIKSELDAEITRRDAPLPPTISFSTNPTARLADIDPANSTLQPWEHIERDGSHEAGKFSREIAGTWHAVADISNESQTVLDKTCTLTDPDATTGAGAYGCSTFGFQTYANRTWRLDVLGTFSVFGIENDVTVGASQLRQHLLLPNAFNAYDNPPYNANNLYNPVYLPNPTVPSSVSAFSQYQEWQWWTQEYFQDRIKFGEHWDLWLGANEGDNKVTLSDSSAILAKAHASGVSPSASLSYAPQETLRFYFTYADAIAPGGTAPISPQYVNSGEAFGPIRLRSYEAGAKWQIADITQLNVSLFDSQQALAFTQTLAPNLYEYTEKGLDRFTGVEINSVSKFPFGLTLDAGLTWLKPLQVDTGTAEYDNQYVPGVPRESVSLYAEYKLPQLQDLTLTGKVRYNSSSPLLPQGGYDLHGYTLTDLGGFYKFNLGNVDMSFHVIVQNVFNERYWSPYYSTITAGAPRTGVFALEGRFGGSK